MSDKSLKNVRNIDNHMDNEFIDEQLNKEETFIRQAAVVETAKEFLHDLSKVEDIYDTILLDSSDLQPMLANPLVPLNIINNTDNKPLAEMFDKLQAGVKEKNGDKP